MESFTLTRIEMSKFLLSLTGTLDTKPLQILQEAWTKTTPNELPTILLKVMKGRSTKGFSLGDIAALGNLIEYSTLSVTAMQNWVKRDFKEYLGSPRQGKKYSVNQAALLFMIDDLKSALDFESIRQLFHRLFLKPERDDDDLIEPAQLYNAYAGLFEKIKNNPSLQNHGMDDRNELGEKSWKVSVIEDSTEGMMKRLAHLTRTQSEAVWNTIFIAAISVQTCYFQSLVRQSLNATLFS
ncbi:MAG: DUF1836 domain-containing protein [Paenibacillus sp.]|nr:DUF1836 domain-containing protein [Paenibacillus sp.]